MSESLEIRTVLDVRFSARPSGPAMTEMGAIRPPTRLVLNVRFYQEWKF